MNLRKLLLIHAIITLAAGLVLVIAPASIPATVNIHLKSTEYLLCYFLGAAELAIAYLSFFSRTIKDADALKIVCKTFIVFHAVTGALELYAFIEGSSPKIISNIMLRLVIVALFQYYGVRQKTS